MVQAIDIRHGDIHIQPVKRSPVAKLKIIKGASLATGSATGHSHRFSPAGNATLYDMGDGVRILRVRKAVKLSHEEHATVTLKPGDYRVSLKRQYDKALGQRPVQD
jgi:hypothetical protein